MQQYDLVIGECLMKILIHYATNVTTDTLSRFMHAELCKYSAFKKYRCLALPCTLFYKLNVATSTLIFQAKTKM